MDPRDATHLKEGPQMPKIVLIRVGSVIFKEVAKKQNNGERMGGAKKVNKMHYTDTFSFFFDENICGTKPQPQMFSSMFFV